MRQKIFILPLLLALSAISFAQTFDSLKKLEGVAPKVYYSNNAKERAIAIAGHVAKAETYFQKAFKVQPDYILLVLSPADWKKYAHPQAIYGIPHYLPDGRLVVAAENNDFWKRNTPPVDKLPEAWAHKLKQTYTDKDGVINLTGAFDLLAVHELGHAFQKAAGMVKQRSWLNELLCNVLLHTYLAENDPQSLPLITVFTQASVASFPPERLKYTKLEDFETRYNELAKNHPDNYGWYQCRFHIAAGDIYDNGGVAAMNSLWTSLLAQKEKLDDAGLETLLKKTHPALEQVINNGSK